MLTIYRSNRAEWLSEILLEEIRLNPPELLETIDIVVNTWPMGKWLSEQISIRNEISALIRFPFPGTYLKHITRTILKIEPDMVDPWEARRSVWEIIKILPEITRSDQSLFIKNWLEKNSSPDGSINKEKWKMSKMIANSFDDYCLYRPDIVTKWIEENKISRKRNNEDSDQIKWQKSIFCRLMEETNYEPFSLLAKKAIKIIKEGKIQSNDLPKKFYIYGVSSLAPIHIELIQSLSKIIDIKFFLLTPCPDLWRRCKNRREELGNNWNNLLNNDCFVKSPGIEGKFGRMGAEFQQLLEGCGEYQLGEWNQADLFSASARMAELKKKEPTLLEQIQEKLVEEDSKKILKREKSDESLLFMASPGKLREVQLIRDQIIQWLAKDSELQPKDILIMTPQISKFAPLIASVFNDIGATGVEIPWRITDRSQQDNPGLNQCFLDILKIGSTRFTSKSLGSILNNQSIQEIYGFDYPEIENILNHLQLTGFRWGLDGKERDGDEIHSLRWCLERWLMGIIFSEAEGKRCKDFAPYSEAIQPLNIKRWWELLSKLYNNLIVLKRPKSCNSWVSTLKLLIEDIFKDGGSWAWEKQILLMAIENWRLDSDNCNIDIGIDIVYEILKDALKMNAGRFGHRSGKLTISALEPMRALPHKIIVLMGLDQDIFPRNITRPSFNLLEQKRLLGDPKQSDQDRYVILESILSARKHLMITWNNKNERTGDHYPPSSPIQQWLEQLQIELGIESFHGIIKTPPQNPLDRNNFLEENGVNLLSCDNRNLKARLWLEKKLQTTSFGIAIPLRWNCFHENNEISLTNELVREWITEPQKTWLEHHDLKAREWINKYKDLDDINFNELERYNLLQDRIITNLLKGDLSKVQLNTKKSIEHWVSNLEGKGILPKDSGGIIEIEKLGKRWDSLISTLLAIGPISKSNVVINNYSYEIIIVGDVVAIIEPGKVKAKTIMNSWITHLQICSTSEKARSTVILSRNENINKQDEFKVSMRWRAIEKDNAKKIIQSIHSKASKGIKECWPIPPESGWALASARAKSSSKGNKAFKEKWEGGFQRKGEREKSEMILCFGYQSNSSIFLDFEDFDKLFKSLYDPIIDNIIN